MANTDRTCSEPGCTRPFSARERCRYHYSIWYKRNPEAKKRPHTKRALCMVDGCESDTAHGGRGYCSMHYQRAKKVGDAGAPKTTRTAHKWEVQPDGHKWRICKGCDTAKPQGDYHKGVSVDGRSHYCKPCSAATARASRDADPEKYRARKVELWNANIQENRRRSREYYSRRSLAARELNWRAQGIEATAAEYMALHAEQGGLCALCGKDEVANGRALALDHCHNSNRVRGLLCADCNMALGLFRDRPEVLTRASQYLSKYAD